MNTLAISEFRSHLSSHLEQVKFEKKALVFWERWKKEFLITSYPKVDVDLFEVNNALEDGIIQKDYYKGLQNTMQDWLWEEHDDLFE